jgi:hypothetical protein
VDLFLNDRGHVDVSPNEENNDSFGDGDQVSSESNFFSILNERICPLVVKLLSRCVEGKHSSFTASNDGDGKGRQGQEIQTPESRSMQMILKLTSLTSSIIVRYGDNELLKQRCFKLLITLAKLIQSATNVLRDSHEFEVRYHYYDGTI